MAKKRYSFDPKCRELADHFLSDVPGATEDHANDLADTIQRICEGVCRELEDQHDDIEPPEKSE